MLATATEARWRARSSLVHAAQSEWRALVKPTRANQVRWAQARGYLAATRRQAVGAERRRRCPDHAPARGARAPRRDQVLCARIPERMLPPVVVIPGQILLDVRPCLQLGNT